MYTRLLRPSMLSDIPAHEILIRKMHLSKRVASPQMCLFPRLDLVPEPMSDKAGDGLIGRRAGINKENERNVTSPLLWGILAVGVS